MIKILYILFISLFWFTLSSANETRNSIVLKFSDFGPPSMSHELLGHDWWQWESNGDSNPKTHYDVKVVVYRNILLEKVKKLYPVKSEKKQDYRYLEYQKALNYLDYNIASLNDWKKQDPESFIPIIIGAFRKNKKNYSVYS